MMSRRKFGLFAAATIVASVVVMLVAVLGLDLYAHHRADRSAGLNRWGYRGPIVGRKQPGEVRVAMLGGSTTFGYGGFWQEAIPALLETELRARHTERRWTCLNLGFNTEGAWAFLPNLEDFSHLDYDIVILYEGYNDLLGDDAPNHVVARRRSPVFRATGYFPILPLVLREKAMSLRTGGHLEAEYGGGPAGAPQTMFRPGIARHSSATALDAAAGVAEFFGRQFENVGVTDGESAVRDDLKCVSPWLEYCDSMARAVRFALARGKRVVVATQPRMVDPQLRARHDSQQRALADGLAREFATEPGVVYVDLSDMVDLTDPNLAFDLMHLGVNGNRVIARALTDVVAGLAP